MTSPSGRIISGSGRKKKQMLIRKRKRRKEKDNGEKLQKQKKIKKLVFCRSAGKQNAADKIMTVEEVQEEVEGISVSTMNQETKKGLQENRAILAEDEPKISEAGRPHPGQAHPEPGSRPPESPRPGSPSPGLGPRPPEPPRPPRPTPGIPYDPFNDGQFTDCRKIKPSDCSTLCRKTAVSVTTVLSCTDIRILAIFCCAEITGVSTYWESPAVTASRNASWQTCLAFHIFGKVRRSTFRAEKVDTGTALLISEWKIEHLYRSIPRISTTGIVRDRISR